MKKQLYISAFAILCAIQIYAADNLQQLEKTLINSTNDANKTKDMSALFSRIESERANLNGKNPWANPQLGMSAGAQLEGDFEQASKVGGIQFLDAALSETTEHDFVRQAILRNLVRYKNFQFGDVPHLINILLLLSTKDDTPHPPDRRWIESETVQVRLADAFQYILNVDEGSRIPFQTLTSDPREWVEGTLSIAVKNPNNAAHARLLNQCLSRIRTR